MVVQNGQLVATIWAPEAMISSARSTLMRFFPGSSSLNIWAPPAPQQSPLDRQRFSSMSSVSSCCNISRGASYIPLALPM